MHLHPQSGVKKTLGVIYRGNLQVHPSTPSAPPDRARVNFYDIFLLGVGDLEAGGSGLFSSFRPSVAGVD